jgi:hypothetical protein
MADITASTDFRNLLADAAAGLYYWATLHGAGGSTLAVGDTYVAGADGELANDGFGYVQGAKVVDYTHATSDGLLTAANAVWSAVGGDIGPASYGACWVSASNDILTAKLLWVDDMSATPQTATNGNDMTLTIGQNITIPTPA